ncbi:hypothetical protein E2C01_025075 [Portunus trituberculatus]|uniref:Uncharacterized protein n=1 Tax=Portunus trituberculatus TaxID=210409 RepID=A0A5B7EE44_PORTR|nr:hypothetical protein [Portunus trituberculatus]
MSGTVSETKDRGASYSGYTTPWRVYRIWRRVYRGTSAQVSNRTLNRKVIKSQERKGSERGRSRDGGEQWLCWIKHINAEHSQARTSVLKRRDEILLGLCVGDDFG